MASTSWLFEFEFLQITLSLISKIRSTGFAVASASQAARPTFAPQNGSLRIRTAKPPQMIYKTVGSNVRRPHN